MYACVILLFFFNSHTPVVTRALYFVVFVEYSTHHAMQKIHAYTPKFNIDDEHRVTTAVEHYEPFIDFDELLKRTKKMD